MLKRVCAIGISCGAALGLTMPTAAVFHSAARAQSADLVLCDRVAADPADPDKPKEIKGVAAIAPSDVEIAIKFCRVASGKSRRALYELGRAYAANRQLPQAIAAYRKAADKGSSSAMVELGVLLANGIGGKKNEGEARELFQRAAKAGNPRGMTNLAALSGNAGAPMDPVKKRALLAKAAEENSAEAQFQLGVMYANGIGGPKDDVAARAMFEKAAAQTTPWRWSGWARLRKSGVAALRTRTPPKPISKERLLSATRTPRSRSSNWNAPT
jgi:TPR repeat protein